MKCLIPGNHVKVFGRAVHSLSRIGDELYIEPLDTGLALRTVNSSRSAYACFLFNPSFFLEYHDGRQATSQGSEEDTLKCKIAMKSCVSVFRSLSSIEKTVERCRLTLNVDDARLVFQLYCRHGIVKTHNLAFIECETLQAVFSPEASINHLTAQSRLLCDVIANFQNNQEEVTLVVNSDRASFKNYYDDANDRHKTMHTELSLDPEEFDTYKVDNPTDITFCLKELRAIMSFSETTSLPLSLHFDTSGKPIIFSMDGDDLFEASFVLATLADPGDEESCEAPGMNPRPHTTAANKSRSMTHRRGSTQQRHTQGNNTTVNIRSDITVGHKAESYANYSASMPHLASKQLISRPELVASSNPDSVPALPIKLPTNRDSSESSDQAVSQIIPPVATETVKDMSRLTTIHVSDDDDDGDEMNDTIPGTPPSKKFKSLFFGASQSTVTTQRSLPQSEVLAVDTDDEDA